MTTRTSLLSKLQGSGFYPGEIILTECASFPLDTPSCRFIPVHCNQDVSTTKSTLFLGRAAPSRHLLPNRLTSLSSFQ